MGIAEPHHAQVFELFKRLHRREQIPGTGIGLALCKRIVERHQGSIALRSEVGIGTSFRISLPHATQIDASLPEQHHDDSAHQTRNSDRHPIGGG
ncbi:MAG: ATP-binding protein [Rhodopirellula sp. JB055]|uniref:ATP-binding protein n=1 Tax=Rhodopirellula sp. JB055 TaxID=3342846 RepID=UPI00370AAB4B